MTNTASTRTSSGASSRGGAGWPTPSVARRHLPLRTDLCKSRRRAPPPHFRHSCVPFRHSCASRNPGDLVAANMPQHFDGLPKQRSRAVERLKRERTAAVRLDSCLRRNDGYTGMTDLPVETPTCTCARSATLGPWCAGPPPPESSAPAVPAFRGALACAR